MKSVVYVDINCMKCKAVVLKAVAKLQGVDKIEVDGEKNTVTVTGDVDPIDVVEKLRKVKKMALLMSAGSEKQEPEKKKEEKEKETLPDICRTCESIYLTFQPYPMECAIL